MLYPTNRLTHNRNLSLLLVFAAPLIALTWLALLQLSRTMPGSITLPGPLLAHPAYPLLFEPNAGQADPSARFLAHSSGGILFFTPAEVTLLRSTHEAAPDSPRPSAFWLAPQIDAPQPDLVRMRFLGADPQVDIAHGADTPARVNYLLGNDPAQWRTALPTYSHITYNGLYHGIDLRYEGNSASLKGTYTLSAGTDPTVIRWRYDTAQSLSIDAEGNLHVTLKSKIGNPKSEITERAPVAWQEIGGERRMVAARYILHSDNSIGFGVDSYDPAYPLTIDPVVVYYNHFGGSNNDFAHRVVLDSAGNAYVLGWTTSSDFPLVNPFQPTLHGINDVYVSKWSADGSTLLYSTYLGGSSQERGFGIAIDSANNVYLTGRTDSDDFPTRNAYQPDSPGAFVTKLNASGSDLVYSTYLGGTPLKGSNGDIGYSITVDPSGHAYVTGETGSPDFPLLNPIQPTYGGGEADVFVTKFNPAGDQLLYSTFLGGSGGEVNSDVGTGIALDPSGNIYVTGYTNSGDFPVANAIQPAYGGGEGDAFVTKLNPAGSAFIYSTHLGGDDNFSDGGSDITADAAGNAYITGMASSTDFPTFNAFQANLRGITDVFITKLNPTGSQFIFSTFLGGNNPGSLDVGRGIVIDSASNVYITGQAGSLDFPTANPIPPGTGGYSTVFLTKLHSSGSSLIYSSYLPAATGYTQYESGGLAIDGQGGVYLTGYTFGPNSTEAFALKVFEGTPGTPTATLSATNTPPPPTATSTQPPSTATATATRTATTTTASPTNTPVAPTSTPTACTVAFIDVLEGSTFYSFVRCLACRGIISGYPDGTFRPNNDVTRGQIAKIVSNSAGFQEPVTGQTFEDVLPGSTFYDFIERLVSREVMSGYPCGGPGEPCIPPANRPYFRPNATATRGQLAKIVSNAANFQEPAAGQTFEDVPPNSTFYDFIQRLITRGVMSGYPCGGEAEPCAPPDNRPYFRPAHNVTRGQTTKIVANTFFPACNPPRP